MSKPSRPSDPNHATGRPRTFFVTTATAGGKNLLQSERMAELLIDVLQSCVRESELKIHDFVVMPNHLHVLLIVPGDLSIEKAMQLIKDVFPSAWAENWDSKARSGSADSQMFASPTRRASFSIEPTSSRIPFERDWQE
jgi:hypothetical protein